MNGIALQPYLLPGLPLDSDEVRRLDLAYKAGRLNNNGIKEAEYNVRRQELAATLREYPYLIDRLARIEGTRDAQEILQALILLRVKAKEDCRKNSHFPSYRHSLRLANKNLAIMDGLITDERFITIQNILDIVHDLEEDFDEDKCARKQIATLFDKDQKGIAARVKNVTTPSKLGLAGMYPEIVSQYVTAADVENTDKSPKAYLELVKNKGRAHYILLKAALKLAFKFDMALRCEHNYVSLRGFDLHEVLTKGTDNSDALESDSDDIKDGSLKIYVSDDLSAPPPHVNSSQRIKWMSTAEAQLKLRDRTKYHEDAILVQFDKLISNAPNQAEVNVIRELKRRVDREFRTIAAAYTANIQGAIDRSAGMGSEPVLTIEPSKIGQLSHFLASSQAMLAAAEVPHLVYRVNESSVYLSPNR